MKLELGTWPEGTTAKEFVEEADALDWRGDLCRLTQPVAVTMTVDKHSDEIIIDGRLRTCVQATCVRCLDEFPIPVDESFRRIAAIVPDKRLKEDTGDPDFTFVPESEPTWDLNDVLRETIFLAVPDNPLCRSDCRGLCPHCGADRNTEPCRCHEQQGGGQLARLEQLMREKNHG